MMKDLKKLLNSNGLSPVLKTMLKTSMKMCLCSIIGVIVMILLCLSSDVSTATTMFLAFHCICIFLCFIFSITLSNSRNIYQLNLFYKEDLKDVLLKPTFTFEIDDVIIALQGGRMKEVLIRKGNQLYVVSMQRNENMRSNYYNQHNERRETFKLTILKNSSNETYSKTSNLVSEFHAMMAEIFTDNKVEVVDLYGFGKYYNQSL